MFIVDIFDFNVVPCVLFLAHCLDIFGLHLMGVDFLMYDRISVERWKI